MIDVWERGGRMRGGGKKISISVRLRVILSAGAMLIFSVFLRFGRVCRRRNCLKMNYVG